MAQSSIEWTESTWNPVTGCTRISPGCQHCYAERMSNRLHGMGVAKYANNFEVTLHPSALNAPLEWKKPQLIFVNSMSDLFHRDVPGDFIAQVFDVMRSAHWHQFQVLTKRASRLRDIATSLDWPSNVWMGVSIENEDYLARIDDLRQIPAQIRFLSIEPLIGPISRLCLDGIHWVIAGGESGPGARPMDPEWVRLVRDACIRQRVPFFFKQWGGVFKKRSGRILDGRTWDQLPHTLAKSA